MAYNQAGYTQQTVVVTQQPMGMGGIPGGEQGREWSSGVFGCFEDITSCLLGYFCAPCYACWLSNKMGEHCCVPICVPGSLIALRMKLRTMENIKGSLMMDCCCVEFCGLCVMCQLKREWDHVCDKRGIPH